MTVTLYGIRNCDRMKKAFKWLETEGIVYRFHDYRKDGVPEADLTAWCADLGWEKLLNRAGTTFRKLPEDQKTDLDQTQAVALMRTYPAMIKRPVLVCDGKALELGFRPDRYREILGKRPSPNHTGDL